MLSPTQIKQLESYRDKSYVSSILFQKHSDLYSLLKNIIHFQLISTTSIMGIINSNYEPDKLKTMNIVLNCTTALILGILNNFKFEFKAHTFNKLSLKMNRLCHSIENDLSDNLDNLTQENINKYINEYDNINESLEFGLIQMLKTKIKKKYKNKKILPNSLNCEGSFLEENIDGELLFINNNNNNINV